MSQWTGQRPYGRLPRRARWTVRRVHRYGFWAAAACFLMAALIAAGIIP